MREEHQVIGMLSASQLLGAVKSFMAAIEPLLGPIFTLTQIIVAIVTIVWIVRKMKGTKLDNERKQKELDKP